MFKETEPTQSLVALLNLILTIQYYVKEIVLTLVLLIYS